MPRPKNLELSAQIRRRYAELTQEYPVGGANLRKLISDEFGLAQATVAYYLKTKKDARAKYTDAERSFFAQASYTELKEWATEHGRPLSTVYSVAMRCRKGPASVKIFASRTERLSAQGYMDFGDFHDISAFGYTRGDVKRVKETILKTVGLTLTTPNLLLQKSKGRHVVLSLPEQLSLLANPTKFLTHTARTGGFKDRWVTAVDYVYVIAVEMPALANTFKEDETDAPTTQVAVAVHERHEEAATALRAAKRYFPVLCPKLRTLTKGTVVEGQVLA